MPEWIGIRHARINRFARMDRYARINRLHCAWVWSSIITVVGEDPLGLFSVYRTHKIFDILSGVTTVSAATAVQLVIGGVS